jgi:hypothetical protein
MPLMHAESLALQDECVARFTRLVADAPESLKQRLQRQPGLRPPAPRHHHALRALSLSQRAFWGGPTRRKESDFLLKGPRFGQ